MRFPIHVPAAVDDRRRPVRLRLAALGVATILAAGGAFATPFAAHAEEAQPAGGESAMLVEAAASEPVAAEDPAPADEGETGASATEPAASATDDDAATAHADAAADPAGPAAGAAGDPEASHLPDAEAEPVAARKSAASAGQPAGFAAQVEPSQLGPNQAPIAVDDAYQMLADTTLTVDDPGVTGNDTEPDGDWYQVDDHTKPQVGSLWVNAHGPFGYTPPAGFTGTVTFTYVLKDDFGALSTWATVTIEVLPAGSDATLPPTANDDTYVYALSTPLYIAAPGVLANDDAEGREGTLVLDYASPQIGTVDLQADGSFLYTPHDSIGGTWWFRYLLCTDGGCASAEVTLEQAAAGEQPSGPSQPPAEPPAGEDLAPVAQPDTLVAVAGDLAILDAPGVLGNDSDPEGQPLTLVDVTTPAHGVLYYWNADGTVQYVPNDGFAGTDQVEYTVSDGAKSATSTLTFTVTEPANYAPQAWEDSAVAVAGTTLILDAPGVLGNDSDQDGDPLAVTWFGDPHHGTIDIAADGSVVYTPEAGFVGGDSVLYQASDGQATSEAFLVIDVVSAGAPAHPTVVGDHYDAVSGVLLEVSAPGVLGNDLDPSGPIAVTGHEAAQHGTIEIAADGSLRYTSEPGYTGVDTIRYTISDGEESADGLISITVLGQAEGSGQPGEGEQPGGSGGSGGPQQPGRPQQPTGPDEPGRPAEHAPLPEARPATTDAAALADTGSDPRLAAALAALLAALGI
ncbi:tandem-95 repeat protein, partial [Agromyces tardus]